VCEPVLPDGFLTQDQCVDSLLRASWIKQRLESVQNQVSARVTPTGLGDSG